LFCIVSAVRGHHKIHFEEQALEAGTKQSCEADKAVRLTRQTGLQVMQAGKAVRLACFVLDMLLALEFPCGFYTI
jgi:hypothetical protein